MIDDNKSPTKQKKNEDDNEYFQMMLRKSLIRKKPTLQEKGT